VLLRRSSDQTLIVRAQEVRPGELLIARFADGERTLQSE